MSPVMAFFIYLLVWWVLLFAVLPFGVRPHGEQGQGYDAGAPANPHLKKKLIVTSLLSAVVVGIMHVLVVTGVIDWDAMFDGAWK